ncbi:MAG: hypothetical protein EA355_14410 [Rhodobacteraceae bacterium]|nr:MAG: hypothetical protein EA355_14410 [Paracoccaceae bacterium]
MPFDATPCTTTRIARPKLLARAARAGAALYRRERDLPAGLRVAGGKNIVAALMAAEETCEAERRAMAPSYSPARHVRLLSALLAEARAAALRAA